MEEKLFLELDYLISQIKHFFAKLSYIDAVRDDADQIREMKEIVMNRSGEFWSALNQGLEKTENDIIHLKNTIDTHYEFSEKAMKSSKDQLAKVKNSLIKQEEILKGLIQDLRQETASEYQNVHSNQREIEKQIEIIKKQSQNRDNQLEDKLTNTKNDLQKYSQRMDEITSQFNIQITLLQRKNKWLTYSVVFLFMFIVILRIFS